MRADKRLSKAEGGNVLIEFAMLAPVFFMMVMGLVEFVLFQYKTYTLNHVVYEATRNLQTGEVQSAADMRKEFDKLCKDSAGPLMNCDDIQWDVRSFETLKEVKYPPVKFDKDGIPENFVFEPGGASEYSVVRATISHTFITPFMGELFNMGPDQPAIVNSFCLVKNEPWT
jgi:hypothetical protein